MDKLQASFNIIMFVIYLTLLFIIIYYDEPSLLFFIHVQAFDVDNSLL